MAHKRSSTVTYGQLIELDDDPMAPREWFIYGHIGMGEAHATVAQHEAARGRVQPRLGAVVHGQARWCPRSDLGTGKAGRAFRYVDDPNTSEGAFKTTRVTTDRATIAAEQEALALALRAAHVQRFVWEIYPEALALRADCGERGELRRVEWEMAGLGELVTMTFGAENQGATPPQPSRSDLLVWAQLYGHRFGAWQSAQQNLEAQRVRGGVLVRPSPVNVARSTSGLPLFDLQPQGSQAKGQRGASTGRADKVPAPPNWFTGWLRRLTGTDAAWARVDDAARRLATMIAEPGWAPRLVVRNDKTEAVAAAMVDRETARLLLTLDAPISVSLFKRAAALCEGVGDNGLAVAITWEGLRAPSLTPIQRAELEGLRAHNLQKQGHNLHHAGHR